jgi:tetratricopeptide (TPR) repeat protein
LNEDLAEQAWRGIIKKISHLLSPLLQPLPMVGTQEERSRRANNTVLSKKSLVEFCLAESSNHLSSQQFSLAFPAAFQALKFCKEIDGERSLSLVEPYLQLSQAVLGMRQLNKAEEYLALARWIVMNNDDCPDRIRSKLFSLKGRVGTSQGHFDSAKEDYAQAIYFASKCYGAESIVTSLGFFHIGDVFLAHGNMEAALAFFDKVVDIWYKFLCELQQGGNLTSNNNSYLEPESTISMKMLKMPNIRADKLSPMTAEQLSEQNIMEGKTQLETIFEHRKRLLGNGHIATGEIQYTLGLFEFLLLSNESAAENMILSALQSYEIQLGAGHTSTLHVHSMLEVVQHAISDKYNNAAYAL